MQSRRDFLVALTAGTSIIAARSITRELSR